MNKFYAAIFGAGICGTALAKALLERNKKVLLIDPYVSENAPGPPAAMVNPATGMRAKLCWRGKKCYDAIRNQIEELEENAEEKNIILDSGIVRPAITEKLAKNFKKTLDKYNWPEGWIRWMEEQEIAELNPEIAPNYGGLYLDCGYTVFVDKYLNTYRKYLRENGVECKYEQANYRYIETDNSFQINLQDDSEYIAEHAIIAAGYQTSDFDAWSHLPLEGVKGQIVQFEADEDLDWEHAISAKGYCMRRGKRDLIVGATYEHNFESLKTTEEAFKRIENKLNLMYPNMRGKLKKKNQMAGVRVTTPNRLPVIGRHHNNEKLCIYTGMNSKGFLYSHYVGDLLADHLTSDASIPEEVDVSRFDVL